MYTQFYGFREKPFRLTPDTDFFYPSSVHKQALAYLTYGLEDRQGFITITGEVGSGKTTVIQVLLNNLKDTTKVAKVNNTKVTFLQLLEMIVRDFGLPVQGNSKTELLEILNKFLIQQHSLGNYVLLIIDEAQNLSSALLEEIRLLSNLETSKEKLLQIILAGQPELGRKLRLPQLRQLAQRITVTYHMTGMDRKDVESYIQYRLQVAGNQNRALFSSEAIDKITEFSRGIPRMINIICDAALLTGFVSERKQIDEAIIAEVIQELKTSQSVPQEEEKEITPQPVPQPLTSSVEVLSLMSCLEKRLDDMASKLEWVCKTIETVKQGQSAGPGEGVQTSTGPELPKTQIISEDPTPKDIFKSVYEENRFEDYSGSKLLHELILRSGYFPLLVSLLKINVTSFFWYVNDLTNLVLWIGTFVQAWFLSFVKPGDLRFPLPGKFLGNLISPFIYSSVGSILQGFLFLYRFESLTLWIYSLLMGTLQIIRRRVVKKQRAIVSFLEILVRTSLIPVLYTWHELERRNTGFSFGAFRDVFTELFKSPVSAYWVEGILILGIFCGLDKILKTKKRV
ncbi:MAG TPA: XrtA/PEP-CTERM system-associated ATPase [Candidatus Limnocylindrales bacterium]|nr:XrtA/PEP-CTERM system-associated ATPase [Candidatus Limnocylindrales bacterium]